jgi:GNAT superfamily N-acetyltransferase
VTLFAEPLGDHELRGFRSGNDELDDWLAQSARAAVGQGTRTWVLVDDDGTVAGYFAVAPHLLGREDVPKSIGCGAPRLIPAVLLAKLALAERLQGQGLGTELLRVALAKILEAAKKVAGRLVVVDAIDADAHRFYLHHDFRPLPNDDRRLVIKLSTVAKALGADWP